MLSNKVYATVNVISDLTKTEEGFKSATIDTLVIFDVDYVLMMPTEDYSLSRNPIRRMLWEEIKENLSEEEEQFLRSIIVKDSKWELLDNNVLNILSDLKHRSIPTIALTSVNTGQMGVIKNREDLRIKELNSLGIKFLDTSPFKENILLENFKGRDGIPLFKKGIIFTAEQNKAIILEQILIKTKYLPSKIIFIDDKLENVKSIENLCNKINIEFIGFHYTKVDSIKPQNKTNKEFEKLLLYTLKRDKIWLGSNASSKL